MYFWYNSLCRLGKLFVKCAMCCVTLTSLCINHQNVWIRKSDPMNFQCCHFTCTEDFPSSQSSLKNNILLNISHILTSHPRRITISIIRSCRGHWPLLLWLHFPAFKSLLCSLLVPTHSNTWQWLWCLSWYIYYGEVAVCLSDTKVIISVFKRFGRFSCF